MTWKMNLRILWISIYLIGIFSNCSAVEESKLGAYFVSEKTEVILYVNNKAANAIDKNNEGLNQSLPFKTITKAMDEAAIYLQKGTSVKVKIARGIYSECCELKVTDKKSKVRETLLVIEGETGTILSGLTTEGVEVSTWSLIDEELNIYEHTIHEPFGIYQTERAANWAGKWIQGTGMRREMIFVDGLRFKPLALDTYTWVDPDGIQKMHKDPDTKNKPGWLAYTGIAIDGLSILKENTFGVCDHSDAPEKYRNKIFMRLPEGKTIADVNAIEIGRHNAGHLINISGKRNLIIRNLTLQYSCSHLDEGALEMSDCGNLLIEDCNIIHNNGTGVNILVDHMTMNRCKINYNGGKGMGRRFDYSLIQNTEFCLNVWRAAESKFLNYDTAGIKIGQSTKYVTLRRCIAVGNIDPGFWHDVHCYHVRYEQCFAYANSSGFFFELSGEEKHEGEDVAESCISVGNVDGFLISDVRCPLVQNCVAINNKVGIRFRETPRIPNTSKGFESSKVLNNTLISQEGNPLISVDKPDEMIPPFDFQNNKYYSNNPKEAFRIDNERIAFEQWRALLQSHITNGESDKGSFIKTNTSKPKSMLFEPGSELLEQAKKMGVKIPLKYIMEADRMNADLKGNFGV